MPSLEERLIDAESEFLSALSKGENALAAFDHRWESLMADADIALNAGHVAPSLPILLHHTATRIATLADISSELYDKYDNITTQFIGEINILMSQLTLTEPLPDHRPIVSSPKSTPEPEEPLKVTFKRRRDCTSSSPCGSTRPRKRSRAVTPSCDGTMEAIAKFQPSLPTVRQPSQAPQDTASQLHTLKRKRRSSEAGCTATGGPQKRLYTGPRLHAVSDSYRTFQSVDSGSYSPFLSSTATQHTATGLDPVDSPELTVDLPSSNADLEPPQLPRLTPLPCVGFSTADEWMNLAFDFLEPELQSFPPSLDGVDLFLQSLTEAPGDELSQQLQPSSPASHGYTISMTSSSLPSLEVDNMPSPTSSTSYPSTPSPQPGLDLGPTFLQFDSNVVDVPLDQNLPMVSPSMSKGTSTVDTHDALSLMRPEPSACDAPWSSLFLSTGSMLTFSISPEPTLSSFTTLPDAISSRSEDPYPVVSSRSTSGGTPQIVSLCPIGTS